MVMDELYRWMNSMYIETTKDDSASRMQSEGIGSPTDHAYQPPGVVTKIESIQTKKIVSVASTTQKKMICTNCNKKINCRCKKCTIEKVKPYSVKENMYLKSEEKEKLETDVYAFIQQDVDTKDRMARIEEEKIRLKMKLDNAMMRIKLKKRECEKFDENKPMNAAHFQKVFASQRNSLEGYLRKKEKFLEELTAMENTVAKQRYQYCITACRLFPVQEYDANVESVAPNSKNNKNWTVVNDREEEEGRRITIRSAYINDKLHTRLTNQLTHGTISLPIDLHPPFAAITNTIQLVHLFNVVFNFRPPAQLNHRELCIRDRWGKDEMIDDWVTLCDSVAYLCAYVGMPTSRIVYNSPHLNLIRFASYIYNDYKSILKLGSKPMTDMAEIHKIIVSQRPITNRKEEEDDTWCFVD